MKNIDEVMMNDEAFISPGHDWSPIETAPKDQVIDLWSDICCSRFTDSVFHKGEWMYSIYDDYESFGYRKIPYKVTHWRLILGPRGEEVWI